MILVYTTYKNKASAEKISRQLLADKLVACVSYSSAKSSYWWGGRIVKESEVIVLYKTANGNWKKLCQTIERLHSYDIPCIMKIEVEANSSYEQWVNEETS